LSNRGAISPLQRTAPRWSRLKISARILCVAIFCLVLFAPYWLLQAGGAIESTVQTVDASGSAGYSCDLDLDSKGNPGIAYYDAANHLLKYAHWNDISWDTHTIDLRAGSGTTTIVFDSLDNPHIIYSGSADDGSTGWVKYAHWTGATWDIKAIVPNSVAGSIVVDGRNYPHISYLLSLGSELHYGYWNGLSWNLEGIDLERQASPYSSMKLDSVGYPHISYYDKYLKIAYLNDTGWHIETVDIGKDVGQHTSLVLDKNDTAYISYYDAAAQVLKLAKSIEIGWITEVVDSAGDTGFDSSLALDQE
jgi:hypothetical protein